MKKYFIITAISFMLSACAGTSGSGNSEMYGTVTGGVETSKTF